MCALICGFWKGGLAGRRGGGGGAGRSQGTYGKRREDRGRKGVSRPEGRGGRKEARERGEDMGTRSGTERRSDEEGWKYGERRWEREGETERKRGRGREIWGKEGGRGKGREKALKWFVSYLKNRTLSVKVSGFQSVKGFLQFGVPQRSVLGPVLFTMYTQPLVNYYKKM